MRQLFTVALALASIGTFGQNAKPRVAILPVLNQSGEKWEALKTNQVSKAEEYLSDQFGKRGFDIIPRSEVQSKLVDQKIDLTDEEQQKRSTLFELAKAVNADYIVFAMITGTGQTQRNRILYVDVEGWCDTKVWLLDVAKQIPIVSAKTFKGRSGGNRMSFDNKGSDRQIQASANALRDALADFFKSFPENKGGDHALAQMSLGGFSR